MSAQQILFSTICLVVLIVWLVWTGLKERK
jgi:hypothetical protein